MTESLCRQHGSQVQGRTGVGEEGNSCRCAPGLLTGAWPCCLPLAMLSLCACQHPVQQAGSEPQLSMLFIAFYLCFSCFVLVLICFFFHLASFLFGGVHCKSAELSQINVWCWTGACTTLWPGLQALRVGPGAAGLKITLLAPRKGLGGI